MVAPVPYGLTGLRRTPGITPGAGLQYRPMNPWRSAAAGGLQGLGGLLMAYGAGQPQQALPAFQAGLQGQQEAEERRRQTARDEEVFGLQKSKYQLELDDAQAKKDQLAQQTGYIDRLLETGVIDASQHAALKSGLAKWGDQGMPGAKPDKPLEVAGLLVDPNDPTKVLADYSGNEIALRKAGASNQTTIVNAGDKENAKTIGKYWGEKLGEIMDTGFAAPKTIAKYKRLGTLLDQAGSGTFTKTGVEFKKALKGAGIDPEAFGITDNTAPADAAEAITNQLAMEMRNPSGGAGMPGAMSDSDRLFLQNSVANLGKTPEGNRMIIEAAVKVAQRDAEVAKMANDYAMANGGIIDGGFFDELQQWSEANPLFADMQTAVPPPVTPQDPPTATGPNGEKLILRNGQWEPM